MGFDYLKGKNWSAVTREERLFCSHLYHNIKQPNNIKMFINWLNKNQKPFNDLQFENKLSLNENIADWEVGYEVCFYRDILKLYGHGVKEKMEDLIANIGPNAVNLIKRTFDLVLFSSDTIVIIEAKSAEGLTTEQFNEFKIDEDLIDGVFKFINSQDSILKIKRPQIFFIILAAETYYKSSSFKSLKGVGTVNLINTQKLDIKNKVVNEKRTCKVDALISWKQLSELSFLTDPLYERAEETYTEKLKSKNNGKQNN